MAQELKTVQLEDGLWMIDDGICHCYLVTGRDRAILLDTGLGVGNIRETTAGITDLPLTLVITHEHMDHLGGVSLFTDAYISEIEAGCLPGSVTAHYVKDGELFDLGGRVLEVMALPGHSVGSIALLNRAEGYMLTGDLFESEKILLHCPTSDPEQYFGSLKRVLALRDQVTRLYPAHLDYPLGMDLVEKVYACVAEYLTGKHEAEPYLLVIPGKEVWVRQFTYGGISITLRK